MKNWLKNLFKTQKQKDWGAWLVYAEEENCKYRQLENNPETFPLYFFIAEKDIHPLQNVTNAIRTKDGWLVRRLGEYEPIACALTSPYEEIRRIATERLRGVK